MKDFYNEFRRLELENGLVVLLKETPTKTVATKLKVKVGSVLERDNEEGISHFLEHSLYNVGSKKYSPENLEHLRKVFGSHNAASTYEDTNFFADMLVEDLPLWFSIISDIVYKPQFREEIVERERMRIIHELKEKESNPEYIMMKNFYEAMFKVSPLRKRSGGKTEVIARLSVDDLRKYHLQGFYPNNSELYVAGGIPKKINELIEQSFGHLEQGNVPKITYEKEGKLEQKSIEVDRPELSKAKIQISFRAPHGYHQDSYAVIIMNQILGVGKESRLQKRISDQEKLTYSIGSFYDSLLKEGWISILTSVDYTEVNRTVDLIFEEMQRLKEGISQKDLELKKKLIRYNNQKMFENNQGIIASLESIEKYGISANDILAKFNAITQEDIIRVANQYLPSDRTNGSYLLLIAKPGKN